MRRTGNAFWRGGERLTALLTDWRHNIRNCEPTALTHPGDRLAGSACATEATLWREKNVEESPPCRSSVLSLHISFPCNILYIALFHPLALYYIGCDDHQEGLDRGRKN
jgi:hypothetical protein